MLRLLINNTEVDLPQDAGIALQRELYDPLEPDKRKPDWSKTFTLPGTAINNRLFGHVFDLSQRIQSAATAQFSPDYNPKKKADAIIDVDGITMIRGFMRLVGIRQINETEIGYEITVHSTKADFWTEVDGKKLKDLDFSDLNHTLNVTNISDSWATQYKRGGSNTAFAYGEGYTYPIIKTENDPNTTNWNLYTAQFKPALFAKEVLDKIFVDSGFTYSSDSFFNETVFKHLIIPAEPNAFELDAASITAREFLAEHTGGNQSLSTGTTLAFQNDSTGGMFDNGSLYNNSTYKYTAGVSGRHSFRLVLTFDVTQSLAMDLQAAIRLNVNGVVVNNCWVDIIDSGSSSTTTSIDIVFDQILNAGDLVHITLGHVRDTPGYTFQTTGWTIALKNGSTFGGSCMQHSYGAGNTVDFIRFFKNEYTQREFVAGFCKMFNLMIDVDDNNPTELIFKPYNDFFTGTMSLEQYRDESRDLTSIPLGELNAQQYVFQYKKANDPESTFIYNTYGDPYGTYRYTVPNDFVTEVKTIEPIFASSPLYNDGVSDIISSYGSVGDSAGGNGGQIRVLYYAGLKDCGSQALNIRDSYLSTINTYTQYPFAAHIDDPTAPTLDISFGMPPVVNLQAAGKVTYTNNNLFNKYWRGFITQITDIDSRVVEGWFRINPLVYSQLTFRKIYQFAGQNFRLLKVTDYNPDANDLTKLTFLRANEPAAFVASTGTKGGGYDNVDANGDKFPADQIFNPNGKNGTVGVAPVKGAVVKGDGNAVGNDSSVVHGLGNVVPVGQVVVLGGDGVKVNSERVISIGETNETRDTPGLFFHGTELDLTAPTDGYVLKYDAGADKWSGQEVNTSIEIIKPSDSSKSLDAVLGSDSVLQFSMASNTLYNIEIEVFFTTTATADFKWALTGPASPTSVNGIARYFPAGSTTETIAPFVAYPGATAVLGTGTTGGYIKINMTVLNGSSSGTFAFQWSQNTSDSGQTKVLGGSIIKERHVSISTTNYLLLESGDHLLLESGDKLLLE